AAIREFDCPSVPASAQLHVFADTKYKLYVNGRYVHAGPCPFLKPVVYVDTCDITPYLTPGHNRIAILAHFVGSTVKYNRSEKPGLLAECRLEDKSGTCRVIGTDEEWRITPLNCWSDGTPRRNWAIEQIEDLQLDHPSFAVLASCASEDYEAPSTETSPPTPESPRVFDRPDLELRQRVTPLLRCRREDLSLPSKLFRGNTEIYNLQDTATRMDREHVWTETDEAFYEITRSGNAILDRRDGEPGFMLLYDFGRVCAGDPAIEVWCEHPCTLDLAMAEHLDERGRPLVWRMGGSYYARYHLPAGLSRVRFYHFNGYRYLYAQFKDAIGQVDIRRVSSHHIRADLDYLDTFQSEDRSAEACYRISQRAIRLNTQAAGYDCNTREQGVYWGDNIWISESVGHMTGDFSHMRHLCDSLTDEVKAFGPFIPGSLLGMGQPLYDYCLVAPELLARYYTFTGDFQTVENNLDAARQIVAAFRGLKASHGLLELAKLPKDVKSGLLFLDHPGIGWHGSTTTGIQRDDVSIGLNAFYLQALQALATCETATGNDPAALRKEEAEVKQAIRDQGWVASKGLFRDSTLKKEGTIRFSQVVNALAVCTGLFEEDAQARHAVRLLLDVHRHPWIAQGTPYSMFFLAEAAARTRLGAEAAGHFSREYDDMIQRGATTTWEGWQGENQDSFCHAWSATLPHLLRRAVMGLQTLDPGYSRLKLNPDLCAFRDFDATCCIPQGTVHMQWKTISPEVCELSLQLPEGVHGELHTSDGPIPCEGHWQGELKRT
nr:alpha-L-rhamnosidase N-terminal domain-containing protein [Kiritimatiellia bacterium]